MYSKITVFITRLLVEFCADKMFQDVILVGTAFDFINPIFYNLPNSFQADSLTGWHTT